MVTIEQLKEWLNAKKREDLIEKIEMYIDNEIQRQILQGKNYIKISTGRPDNDRRIALINHFYELWCNKEVDRKTLIYVRNTVIEKYQSIGLIVKEERFDEGWNQTFEGLSIQIYKELLKE